MRVVHERCAGLDVHKKTVVACVLAGEPGTEAAKQVRAFTTMKAGLEDLREWLVSQQVKQVAMESTGSYWKPVWAMLEGFDLLLANAAHIKAVPGRKTDVKDAEWIAELLRHGLLRGSFIPAKAQRQLRELTRHRTILLSFT